MRPLSSRSKWYSAFARRSFKNENRVSLVSDTNTASSFFVLSPGTTGALTPSSVSCAAASRMLTFLLIEYPSGKVFSFNSISGE